MDGAVGAVGDALKMCGEVRRHGFDHGFFE